MGNGIEKTTKTKLTLKRWLEFALELLIKEGNTKLRIDNLVRSMGVTKGSFYWHFKNRDDFTFSLVKHWIQMSTLVVVEHMQQRQGDAKKRLFELMKFIVINRLTRYDVAIRAWALIGLQVAHIVRQADQRRLDFVRNLFAEMGFERNELEMLVSVPVF